LLLRGSRIQDLPGIWAGDYLQAGKPCPARKGLNMPTKLGYERRDAEKLEARRFAAIARLRRGESASAVARSLGVAVQSVQRWALWYRLHGDVGLRRRPKTGSRPKLAREKLARLSGLLKQGPMAHGFETPVWTSERIASLIWRRFRVRYSRDHVHRLLPRLGWRWYKHTWLPAKGRTDLRA
jgi:transposase